MRHYCRAHGDRVCAACSAVTTAPRRSTAFTVAPLPELAECAFCFALADEMCRGCGRYFCIDHGHAACCCECRDVRQARVGLGLLAVVCGVAAPLLGLSTNDLFSRMLAATLALLSASFALRAALAR
jgi:hypothetical protein